MTWSTVLLLIVAGFGSGFCNTLASSGSILSLPMLIFLGLPATVANGTNRINLLFGSIAAVITFHQKGLLDWRRGLLLCVPMLSGAWTGAKLASIISAGEMDWAVTGATLLALVLILCNPHRLLHRQPNPIECIPHWQYGLYFLIGIWAGFIVLDSATYLLLALVLCSGYGLMHANAIKALLLLGMSLLSLIILTEAHEVNWTYGILLGVGSIAGSVVGGLLASKEAAKVWVVRLLIVLVVIELINLVGKFAFGWKH